MTRSPQDPVTGVRASAVVLAVPGDDAPRGPRLAGETLYDRALRVLTEAGVPDAVALSGPGGLLDAVSGLRARGADLVVVHDPRAALVGSALLRAVIAAAVSSDAAGATPVRPMTDTLKRVDGEGTVLGTVDRVAHRTVHLPQVYRAEVLETALRGAPEASGAPDAVVLLAAVLAVPGCRVVPVEAAADLLTVSGRDSLELAETLLALHGPTRATVRETS